LQGKPSGADWTTCQTPGKRADPSLRGGHLIAARLGGDGSARDAKGGCTNITPLDYGQNILMRGTAENTAWVRAQTETIFYLVIPAFNGSNPVPYTVNVYIVGSTGFAQSYAFTNPLGAASS